MNRKENSRRDPTPRVYDKKSGEYRPVAGRQEQNAPGRKKYATPQRRSEIRRRRRRRFLLVFYILLFLAVTVGAVVVSLTVLFKIDTIEVAGTSRYPADVIIKTGGISKGENLFLADTGKASAAIQQKLPYIGTAKVSRGLPAKIKIEVAEVPVSGAVEDKGKYIVIGTNGKVLELAGELPKNCPVIKGLSLAKAEVGKTMVYKDTSQKETFESLTAAINTNKLGKITEIDLRNPSKIQILYDSRILMNLGLPSDFDYKIRFAKTILDEGGIKENEQGVLNLSVAAEDNKTFFDPSHTVSSAPSSQSSSK
ncbi:cell division protein FtsQ/DivIB [Caproiciproducens galactitolivorans]|uniref:FtsQ-type POTRA domain-containing protein n=1 Tax=Caproiciproducens galactitolivorans TaxID=642589 RepID=A0ABT4BPE5_9FIRM|nr:FtsQ-type POTRA domain-containing protein [Caproiciproducens galactitolivorans]MCY1712758.1 FtsQ-type POTRA domain-containing protein [Caproiciproducens galactitolivorans]